jgi:hypothetical protein
MTLAKALEHRSDGNCGDAIEPPKVAIEVSRSINFTPETLGQPDPLFRHASEVA